MSIHGHRLKKLPQTALLLARHYQGWKTADMVDELARKFDDPVQLRKIQRLRKAWREYETVDDNPLAKELGWTK
jgi:hypothetical protein